MHVIPAMRKFAFGLLERIAGHQTITDSDGMTTVIGGSAIAIGDSTLAMGQVDSTMVDHGRTTIATGTAVFTAATSDTSGAVSAATFAFADGADLFISRTQMSVGGGEDLSGETSMTRFIAIDIDGWAPPCGAISLQIGVARSADYSGSIDGNLAMVDADAAALGSGGIAMADTSSLTINSTYSAVYGFALTGIA